MAWSSRRDNMKKRLARIVWVMLIAASIVLFTACVYQNREIVIRIPFAELQSGGYYGGNLIYHPKDPSSSHIGRGTLIAFMDITYGWEDQGNDEYCPKALSKRYGYLFITQIDVTKITYDYLIYDESGRIIETGLNVALPLLEGDPVYSLEPRIGFSGISFFSNPVNCGDSLKETYLLNFRQDIPVEDENGEIPFQETYRRIIFRIQGDPESPFEYEKGIIGASYSAPHTLVVNSSYHSEFLEHGEATETTIAFFKNENLPEFHAGDYVLDARYGIVRKVLDVDDTNPAFRLLHTELSHMDEAVGTVLVKADGNLEEIIRRYGSSADRLALQKAINARYRFNLFNKEWDIPILERDNLKVDIENNFSIDVNLNINFDLSWKEISSHGSISFPISVSSVLAIDALLGFEKNEQKTIADPGVSFTISGIPVRIDVPIDFIYSIKAVLAELNFEFGPELGLELGFSYNIGAKIKFKLKVIPVGVETWDSASGIYHMSTGFIGPNVTFSARPELTSTVGFQFQPGITIACVVRPQMSIVFDLMGNLWFGASPKLELKLQFLTYGDLQIKIDAKFISKTFNLGRVFSYLYQIGDWTF